jgi:hypothetical protein
MADPAGDCGKNFQFFHQVIYVWHLLRYALMMNGVAVGPRLCNTALLAKDHLMVMQLEIFYLPPFGIAMKIQLPG